MPDLQNITTVKLYTDKPEGNPIYIYAKQLDKNTRYIKAQIYTPEGLVSIPASATVQMNCTLPNNNKIDILSESIEEDGSVLFKLKTQVLALVGNVSCDITIFVPAENDSPSNDGSQQLTTSTFYITVLESNYSDEAISALNESSTLLGLISTVQNLYKEIEEGITNVTPTYVLNWDNISASLSNLQSMYAAHTAESPTTYNAYLVVGNRVLREISFELRTASATTVAAFSFADLTGRDDGSLPTYEVALNTGTSSIIANVLSTSVANYAFQWYNVVQAGGEIPQDVKQHNIDIYSLLSASRKPYSANMTVVGNNNSKYKIPLMKVSDNGRTFMFADINVTDEGIKLYEFVFNQAGTDYTQTRRSYTTSIINENDEYTIPNSRGVMDYVYDQLQGDFDSPSSEKGATTEAIANYVEGKISDLPGEYYVDLSEDADNTEVYIKIIEALNNNEAVAAIVRDGQKTSHTASVRLTSDSLYIDYDVVVGSSVVVGHRLIVNINDYSESAETLYSYSISSSVLEYSPTALTPGSGIAAYVPQKINEVLTGKDEVDTIGDDAYFLGTRSIEVEGEARTEIVKYPVPNGVPVYTVPWYGETPTSAQRLEIKEVCDEIVAYAEACEVNLVVGEETGTKEVKLESLEKDIEGSGYKLVFTDSDSAGNAVSYIVAYDGTSITSSIKALIAEEFDINSNAAPSMAATDAHITDRIDYSKTSLDTRSSAFYEIFKDGLTINRYNLQGMCFDGTYIYFIVIVKGYGERQIIRKVNALTGDVAQYIPYNSELGFYAGHGNDLTVRENEMFIAPCTDVARANYGRSLYVYSTDLSEYYSEEGYVPSTDDGYYEVTSTDYFKKKDWTYWQSRIIPITDELFGFTEYKNKVGGLFDTAGNEVDYEDVTIGSVAYDRVNDQFILGLNNDVGLDSKGNTAYKLFDKDGNARRLYAFLKYTPGQLGGLGTFDRIKTIGCNDLDMPNLVQGIDVDGKYIYQSTFTGTDPGDNRVIVYDYDGNLLYDIPVSTTGELEDVAIWNNNLYLAYAGGQTYGETTAPIAIDKIVLASKYTPNYLSGKTTNGYEEPSDLLARFKNKRILCVGDSITQANFKAKTNWVDYIRMWLHPKEIINDGVDGTGIRRYVRDDHDVVISQNYYDRADGYSTAWSDTVDIILIMGNMNDYSGGIYDASSLGTYGDDTIYTQYGMLKLYLDRITQKFPKAKFGWIVSTPRYYSSHAGQEYLYGKNSAFEGAVTAIKDMCGSRSIPVLDLYHESNLMPWLSDNNDEYFTTDIGEPIADGVHPNSKGHEVIAHKIYDFVVKNF